MYIRTGTKSLYSKPMTFSIKEMFVQNGFVVLLFLYVTFICTISFKYQSFGKEMFLCDPTSQEEYKPMDYTNITSSTPLTGNLTSIYLSSLGELTGVLQKGVLDVMISSRVMEVCLEGCLRIRERIKTFLNEFETERKRNM